jgi:hypothetical protein
MTCFLYRLSDIQRPSLRSLNLSKQQVYNDSFPGRFWEKEMPKELDVSQINGQVPQIFCPQVRTPGQTSQ